MMRSTAFFRPSEPRTSRPHFQRWLILLLGVWILLAGCVSTSPVPPIASSSLTILSAASAGVVSIKGEFERGTGIVVSRKSGYWAIVTCAHVIDRPRGYTVDGLNARVIGVNKDADVGVLAVKDVGQKYRPLHSATHITLLEHVTAVGILSDGWVFMDGHISSLDLDGDIGANTGVQPGMSGGPLLDDAGDVVAMTEGCAVAWAGSNETLGLFTPAKTVSDAVAHLDTPQAAPTTVPNNPYFPWMPSWLDFLR